jgi:hypothetical protein
MEETEMLARIRGTVAGLRGHHAKMPAHWRGMVAGTGAIGFGIWLGVVIGLLTRPRRQQPTGPMIYTEQRPDQTRATT